MTRTKAPPELIPTEKPGVFISPSQSQPGRYHVITGVGALPVCDCPSAEHHGGTCKHTEAAWRLVTEESHG